MNSLEQMSPDQQRELYEKDRFNPNNPEGLGMGPTLREFFTILINPLYWIRTIAGGIKTLAEERKGQNKS